MSFRLPDFTESDPPDPGELVAFLPELRAQFESPLRGTFFRFLKVQHDAAYIEDVWIAYDEIHDTRVTLPPGVWHLIRRTTLSERDRYSRQLDPAVRQRDANLRQVFAPSRSAPRKVRV